MKKERIVKNLISLPQRMLCPVTKQDILSDSFWIVRLNRSFSMIRKLFPWYSFKYYLYNVITTISLMSLDDNVRTRLSEILNNAIDDLSVGDDVSMLACIIANSSGLIDDRLSKSELDFCNRTSNDDYRYWLTMDISKVCFSYQKGFYKNYYLDRKCLMKRIAEDGHYSRLSIQANNNYQVCIITYELTPSLSDSIQRVSLMFSKGLKSRYSIHIVVLDSFFTPLMNRSSYGTISGYRGHLSKKREDKLQKMVGDDIVLHLPDNMNYKKRNEYVLSEIGKINPRFIIDITDEFSPVSYIYSTVYPTFYMPMRVGASSSYFSYLLNVEWISYKINEEWPFLDDSQTIVDWGFPEYVPSLSGSYSRSELGFTEDDFIILTIAKVKNECDKGFVDGIAELLKSNDRMKWLIVGDVLPDYFKEEYPDLIDSNKAIERSYEKQLSALCSICDVLLRTNNSGGSGGTAIAAMNGLPIVMTNYECDSMRWLGRDYSEIESSNELFNEIDRLAKDSEYYAQKSKQCRTLVERAKDSPEKWTDLINRIEMELEKRSDGKKPN